VVDAMREAEARKIDHFARHMHGIDETSGYVFLILAHHGEAPGDAYTAYRKRRVLMLKGYALNMLSRNPALKRAIGIGIDASSQVTGRKGGSEDFYALEVNAWTPELEKQAQELKAAFGLLDPDKVTEGTADVDEFPRASQSSVSVVPKPAIAEPAEPMMVTIKPDKKWSNMWRVHLPNGYVSDITNLTRAKDAGRSLGGSRKVTIRVERKP
jgi:hypothetical protein